MADPLAQPDLSTDTAIADREAVQKRLQFNYNPDLTVANIRKQNNIIPEQPAQQPVDNRGTFTKVAAFIGKPIIDLVGRDIAGAQISKGSSDVSSNEEQKNINLIQDIKDKYANGLVTKEQFNQSLTHIRDINAVDSGADLPTNKQAIGDVAGSALTVAPIWEIRALKGLPLLQKAVRGGIYGAAFMGSAAASENEKADAIIKSAGVGALFGAPLEIFGGAVIKAMGGGFNKVLGKVATKIEDSAISTAEKVGASSKLFSSVATRLRSDFGEFGGKIVDTFEHASTQAKLQIGQAMTKLNDVGFFGLEPDMAWRNPDSLLNQLEGRAPAGNDKIFQVADQMRREISGMATELLPEYRGLDNYFPHIVHQPEYLQKAGPIREEILQNMVLNEGFDNVDKAASTIDDFILTSAGDAQKGKPNAWVQYMLDKGYAQNEEEAIGKTVRYFGNKDTAINKSSNFLEQPRDVKVPFYDPNPGRVLPLYAMDSYGRLNIVRGFGNKDQLLNEMVGKIKQTQQVDDKELNTLINVLFNHVKSNGKLEKWSSTLRALNVFKLTFSAIINPGQHLNNLLVADFGSFGKGWMTALTNKNQFLENGIKTGASVEYFIRNELLKRGYTASFADKYLRTIGFSSTERFNRNFSATVGINYADKLANEIGLTPTESDKANILQLIEQHKAEQVQLGSQMRGVREKSIESYNKDFPLPFNDPAYALKTTKQAQGRLNRLEQVYGQKTERLQSVLDDIEKKMSSTAISGTKKNAQLQQGLGDLEDAIKSTREEMQHLLPQEEAVQQTAFSATDPERFDATQKSIGLAREKLQGTLSKLQERLQSLTDESFKIISDQGEHAPQLTEPGAARPVSAKPKFVQDQLVELNRHRDAIQQEIVGLQNELTQKERLLSTIIDPRATAEAQLNKANPNRGAYKKFLQQQTIAKGDMTPLNKQTRNMELELADLIGGPEKLQEAKLRGFLTEEDKLVAGQVLSEMTQFSSDPGYLPELASGPLGKLWFQYKNFGYRQSMFMKNRVADLIERRDYAGLFKIAATMATVMPMTSEVLLDLRSLLTGEKRPTWGDRPVARYFDDFFRIGGIGIMYDAINSANYGKLTEFIAGPSVASIGKAGESAVNIAGQVAKGDFGKAAGTAVDAAGQLLTFPRTIINRFKKQRRQKGQKSFYDELFSQANNPFSIPTARAAEDGGSTTLKVNSNGSFDAFPTPDSFKPKPANVPDLGQAALTSQGITDGSGNIVVPGPTEQQIQEITSKGKPKPRIGTAANVVAGVDITKYATNPAHERNVKQIYNSLPDFKTIGDIDNHIKAKAPKSPITGSMVVRAADKYNIDPKLLIAIMREDSGLGTRGLGVPTRNPGNVGNNDRGQKIKYKSWDAGVEAVARFLSKYKVG